jgi:GTP-binding protein
MGTREIVLACAERLAALPKIERFEADYVPPEPEPGKAEDLTILHFDDIWTIEGPWLQRLASSVNFSDYESRMYFDRMMRKAGVYDRMEEMGVKNGDTVSIYDLMFEYHD